MSYITDHDQPGTRKSFLSVGSVAAKANGVVGVAFVTPFKCVIDAVYYRPLSTWAAADHTNYCNLVLSNLGVNGTATPAMLGTICGSSGTPGNLGSANVLYAGGTTQYAANTVFVGTVGTIGAGSVAVPHGVIETHFKGC